MPQFDWMQWNAQYHAERSKAWLTTTVRYEAPGVGFVDDIQAVIGSELDHDVDDTMRVAVDTERRDWIITRTDLVIAGELHKPKPGDRIEWTAPSGEILTYEVRNENGQSVADEHDRYRYRYRIHTKLRASEQP